MKWTDITVKQFIKITELGEIDITEIGTIMELISIIYNMTFEEVQQLPIQQGAKYRGEIVELLSTELVAEKFETEFTIGSIHFEIADLQNNWQFSKNIDLEYMAKDMKNFAIVLAILYYPKDKTYETNTAIELAKIIETKKIADVYGAWYFFFLGATASVKITENYSLLDLLTEGTKLTLLGLKNPDRLLPTLDRVLWRKYRKSGLPIV